jgi:hypothetical protein
MEGFCRCPIKNRNDGTKEMDSETDFVDSTRKSDNLLRGEKTSS